MKPRFTRRGFEVEEAPLRAHFGKRWKDFLKTVIVRAVPQQGTPAAALARLRQHLCFERDTQTGRMLLPRRFAGILTRGGLFAAQDLPYLVEPRHYFGGEISPVRSLEPMACDLEIPLYPYQETYVDYLITERLSEKKCQTGEGQVYVHVGTGKGKTLIAMALISRLQVPTCVVVPTIALQLKGVEEASRALPHLTAAAYSDEKARKCEKKGTLPPGPHTADIVFCVVNTARKKEPEFFRGYGMVILDEAHEYHAPSSSALLWNAQAPRIVGLSATPLERPDKMDRVVVAYLGRPLTLKEVVPPEQIEDVDFAGRVREVWYTGHPDYAQNVTSATSDSVSAILTIGKLIRDPHRMEMVAAEVERLLHLHETLPREELAAWGLDPTPSPSCRRPQRHSVFVFAEHREYLPALQAALCRRVKREELYVDDPGPEGATVAQQTAVAQGAVVLRGGATKETLYDASQTRVVLTTYGFSRRGISYSQMTALVEATPRRHGFTQILGRICRLTPDLDLRRILRVVVDVRDVSTSLVSQGSERRKAYQAKEWPVYKVKCKHDDFPLPLAAPGREQGKAVETAMETPVPRRKKGVPDGPFGPEERPRATLNDL